MSFSFDLTDLSPHRGVFSGAAQAIEAVLVPAALGRMLLWSALLLGCTLAAGRVGGWFAAEGAKPCESPSSPAASPLAAKRVDQEPLPAGATVRFGSPSYRHLTAIKGLAVSNDGKIAVAHSGTLYGGMARAYDLTTGRVLFAFNQESTDVEALTLSPNGLTLALKHGSTGAWLYDMTNGERTALIPLPKSTSLFLYAPDGRHLVVASVADKCLHLAELPKGEIVQTFPCAGTVFAAALSPDGKHLVAGGYDYEQDGGWFARRWEVATGRELNGLPLGGGGIPRSRQSRGVVRGMSHVRAGLRTP